MSKTASIKHRLQKQTEMEVEGQGGGADRHLRAIELLKTKPPNERCRMTHQKQDEQKRRIKATRRKRETNSLAYSPSDSQKVLDRTPI